MSTRRMIVRGAIRPAKPETVELWTKQIIQEAFRSYDLSWAMNDTLGEQGIIEIDDSLHTYESRHSAFRFISQLRGLIVAEDIAILNLTGRFLVTDDNPLNPLLMQINVRNRSVYYQDGHIQWESETAVR